MGASELIRSSASFIVAGLREIGGYLVWLWLRDRRSVVLGDELGRLRRAPATAE